MDSRITPWSQVTQLQTGDVLVVRTRFLVISHYAIVFTKDGKQYLAENKPLSHGLRVLPLDEYTKNRTIVGIIRNAKTSSLTDEYIQKRIDDCAPIGYRVLTYNCEDFVRDICDCDIGLDQRVKLGRIALFSIGVIILLYFLFRSNKSSS